MRNLTIKRAKRFVGCLWKMKVYWEDPQGDTVINGTPCRKVGELKNGEEKTFFIGEESGKVFVIADALSKNYCNEFYALPEGQEDVFLSGKNKFNPMNGNAFRFDGNDTAEVVQNRKKGSRRGLLVLGIAALVGVVIGRIIGGWILSDSSSEPQTFSCQEMRLTLTHAFTEVEMANYTACYGSKDVAVYVLKEPFSLVEGFGDYSLAEYGEAVMQSSNVPTDTVLEEAEDHAFFAYQSTSEETAVTYRYCTYLFKATDAFWVVQFAVDEERYEAFASPIEVWAASVAFS